MLSEADLLALLDGRGIGYELYRHKAVFSSADGVPGIPHAEDMAKNLFVQTAHGRERFLVTVPLMERVGLRELARELGCGHLGFVPGEQMEGLIGVTPGSATPFALLNDPAAATLILDASFSGGHVSVHPLHNEASLRIASGDLVTLLESAGADVRVRPVPRAQ